MKKYIILIFSLVFLCRRTTAEFRPNLLALLSAGNVSASGKEIKTGDIIPQNTEITLAGGSFCDLQIIDADSLISICLAGKTEFHLKSRVKNGEKWILPFVKSGTVLINVKKLASAENLSAGTSCQRNKVSAGFEFCRKDEIGG